MRIGRRRDTSRLASTPAGLPPQVAKQIRGLNAHRTGDRTPSSPRHRLSDAQNESPSLSLQSSHTLVTHSLARERRPSSAVRPCRAPLVFSSAFFSHAHSLPLWPTGQAASPGLGLVVSLACSSPFAALPVQTQPGHSHSQPAGPVSCRSLHLPSTSPPATRFFYSSSKSGFFLREQTKQHVTDPLSPGFLISPCSERAREAIAPRAPDDPKRAGSVSR